MEGRAWGVSVRAEPPLLTVVLPLEVLFVAFLTTPGIDRAFSEEEEEEGGGGCCLLRVEQ